jgi:hypothetical protein
VCRRPVQGDLSVEACGSVRRPATTAYRTPVAPSTGFLSAERQVYGDTHPATVHALAMNRLEALLLLHARQFEHEALQPGSHFVAVGGETGHDHSIGVQLLTAVLNEAMVVCIRCQLSQSLHQ